MILSLKENGLSHFVLRENKLIWIMAEVETIVEQGKDYVLRVTNISHDNNHLNWNDKFISLWYLDVHILLF